MPLPAGTSPGISVLDGPPPNPALQTGQNPGTSLASLAGGDGATSTAYPSGVLVPEVMKGVLEASQGMADTLDAFAEAMPQWAADWQSVKAALLAAMSKVVGAGAPPTSPTNPGGNFPGGGFDQSLSSPPGAASNGGIQA